MAATRWLHAHSAERFFPALITIQTLVLGLPMNIYGAGN